MVENIGVIGAGQMGSGIAQVCAQAGFRVRLTDISREQIDRGLAGITRRLDRRVEKGALSADQRDAVLDRIETATVAAFPEADVVIEAATEDEEVKRGIFAQVVPTLREDAILCSNTSSLSITRLATAAGIPGRFMGMHFMNPVPAMPLVELIRGIGTEDETYERVRSLAERLDKTPVSAGDYPAFILNRILLPMINEAIFALHEGVGSVEAIDTSMKLGANHPMGPLELADFIGLDTCLAVMRVLHDGFGDGKYRPCPLLVKYVEAGWLGRKSGRGFYVYEQ